ncbi:hypothetical protein POTOM_038689 [Populus tomentosa]|uniref:CASP-like protein n=1 Tax=Populus tomentosa TaxID=118781 RepID=A0A8X8CDN5_POPTO|nr:hypothetical protein POTOM_038689 [Populus tomentosa]
MRTDPSASLKLCKEWVIVAGEVDVEREGLGEEQSEGLYMLAAVAFGLDYIILQIALTLNHIVKGNGAQTSGDGNLIFDFYGDKLEFYSRMMAGNFCFVFGLGGDKFFNKGYACASLLLLGFVCTAILSVFSSYALPKKV